MPPSSTSDYDTIVALSGTFQYMKRESLLINPGPGPNPTPSWGTDSSRRDDLQDSKLEKEIAQLTKDLKNGPIH